MQQPDSFWHFPVNRRYTPILGVSSAPIPFRQGAELVQDAFMSASVDTAFYGHPRGLQTLFFTEMWERFSYYGMRAILLLYMTAAVGSGGMGLSAAEGAGIYGAYTAGVYMAAIPGGFRGRVEATEGDAVPPPTPRT